MNFKSDLAREAARNKRRVDAAYDRICRDNEESIGMGADIFFLSYPIVIAIGTAEAFFRNNLQSSIQEISY